MPNILGSETSARGKLAGVSPNVIWLSVVSLLTDVSSESTLTTLPLFLANVLGVKTAIIGLIEGVAETTASLMKVFSGYLSDRLGRRKRLTVVGYALSALAKPFLYVAGSWLSVLSVRVADRLGKGIRTAPRDALIADSAPPPLRGRAFGLHRAGDSAGAFLGLAIAAAVIYASQRFGLQMTRATYQKLVLVGLAPAIVAVIVLALLVVEVAPAGTRATRPRLSMRGFDRRFRVFIVVVVLFALGNSSDAFLLLRAQNVGLSVLQVALMLVSFNLVYTVIAAPAGVLSDRWGRRRVILAGWIVYGLIYLGFAVARAGWQVWALYALYGVYYGAVEGVGKALVADVVEAHQLGTAYGVYNAAVGLAAFPASLIAGVLWQGAFGWGGFGPSAPFYSGAALALLAAFLLVVWMPMAGPRAA